MFLLMYEISGKEDIHGLRMRLIYALRKQNAIQLLRSSWLIPDITPELQSILGECIYHGFPVLITKWDPLFLPGHLRSGDPALSDLLIGVIIHSPEVTELGITAAFLKRLEADGLRYHAILGGVMGRLAILDAKLEEKVFINHSYKPSGAIDHLIKRNVDLIILLNQGISRESGLTFGAQVIEKSSLLPFFNLPVIQLDRLRDKDAFLVNWTTAHPLFQRWIAEHYPIPPIQTPTPKESIRINGEYVTRILRAVQIGDKILVNGVVIGEVTSNHVEITTKSGQIYSIEGGTKDNHGIEKLGQADLATARTTTLKSLRRVHLSPKRVIPSPRKKTNTIMLTWRGESIYYHVDRIDALVSIGDDTTLVSTEILSRFSLPIIGIIDGDSDGILYDETSLTQLAEIAPPHSLFIQVKPESDDVVGRLIEKEIFQRQSKIKYTDLEELKKKILEIAHDYLLETVTT
jgi:hypothetical protein